MKPTGFQLAALKDLIRELGEIRGKTQAELVRVGAVQPSEVSKLKRGDGIGQAKWKQLVDHLVKLAGEPDIPQGKQARIQGLVADLTRVAKADSYEAARIQSYPELDSAYRAMMFSRHLPFGEEAPSRWSLVERQDFYLVASNYLNGAGEELAERLRDTIRDLLLIPHEGDGRKNIRSLDGEDYGSILRLSRVITAPVLCAFPFFMTRHRRTLWGVVPYAQHKRFGVVLPKQLLAITSSLAKDATGTLTKEQFGDLLDRGDIVLHSLAGHATEEILCDMVIELASRTPELLRKFNEALETAHDSVDDLLSQLNRDGWIRRLRDGKEYHALTFDLAYLGAAREAVRGESDLAVFELTHGVSVPVGIGFSLPAFRWISAGTRYETLRDAALETLQPYEEQLSRAGIELVGHASPDEPRKRKTAPGRKPRQEGVDRGTRRTAGARKRQR